MSNQDDSQARLRAVLEPARSPAANWSREHLDELERRSLLAEQARQLAHSLRSPLSVIGLIGETLQVDLAEDQEKRRRLDQVLDAVGRLSAILSETVTGTRFADGPQQQFDAAAMAAQLVQLHGGRAELDGHPCSVRIEPDGFTAAILHALHLVRADAEAAGREPQPVLRCTSRNGTVTLDVAAEGADPDAPAPAGPDRPVMIRAAERVARDHGGSVSMEPGRVIFSFPADGAGGSG